MHPNSDVSLLEWSQHKCHNLSNLIFVLLVFNFEYKCATFLGSAGKRYADGRVRIYPVEVSSGSRQLITFIIKKLKWSSQLSRLEQELHCTPTN